MNSSRRLTDNNSLMSWSHVVVKYLYSRLSNNMNNSFRCSPSDMNYSISPGLDLEAESKSHENCEKNELHYYNMMMPGFWGFGVLGFCIG